MLGTPIQFMETSPLFSYLFTSYYSSAHPCRALETHITQGFWHVAPCLLLGTAFSNADIVGIWLWSFCLWAILWAFGNIQRSQIRFGNITQIFLLQNLTEFFTVSVFTRNAPKI